MYWTNTNKANWFKNAARKRVVDPDRGRLGLLLIFGWQQWRAHRALHRLDAATQYGVFTSDMDKKDTEAAKQIAATLQKDYADTPYSTLAALRMADNAAGRGDHEAAQTALQSAYQDAGNEALKTLSGLYLARGEIANKNPRMRSTCWTSCRCWAMPHCAMNCAAMRSRHSGARMKRAPRTPMR